MKKREKPPGSCQKCERAACLVAPGYFIRKKRGEDRGLYLCFDHGVEYENCRKPFDGQPKLVPIPKPEARP
jgi:hypothetical protein